MDRLFDLNIEQVLENWSDFYAYKLDDNSGTCEALCCPWQRSGGTRGRVT